jgi:hypothetical protein
MTVLRIEHRTEGETHLLGHTDAPAAAQAALSARAMQLIASGATGELVLVDEATGEVVARRSLQPEHGADGQRGAGRRPTG